jgi:type IV secretion system protein TrbL
VVANCGGYAEQSIASAATLLVLWHASDGVSGSKTSSLSMCSGGTFQQIEQAANAWIPTIMQEASFLFYVLARWTFAWGAPQLLREHDFNGLFLSLIKKLLVISFFYAVLINGQTWIPAIVNSFAQLGANAAGVSVAQNPSDIMTQGLQIVSDLLPRSHRYSLLTEPGGAITTILAACIVLASYIIITLHYVVTKLEAIIVMSAGYIFLGFGGSRWTSPYFERYISLAVSTGVRLMLIYLMLGVFKTISNNWIATMNGYTADQPITQIFPTLMSMLLFAFASWMIPKMAASIASGTLGSRRGGPGRHGRGDWQSGCARRGHGCRGRGNRRSRGRCRRRVGGNRNGRCSRGGAWRGGRLGRCLRCRWSG